MDNAAFVALNRFGFGRRPEQPLPADPRAWLRTQLEGPDATPSDGLADTASGLAAVNAQFATMGAARAAKAAGTPPPAAATACSSEARATFWAFLAAVDASIA